MKLKKLIKRYNGYYLQLHYVRTGKTLGIMDKHEIRSNYWEDLERKVLCFEITKRCESNEPVLWVEIL